jgi:beta-glucosidase
MVPSSSTTAASARNSSKFPEHFVWGAAAASYQIEGAVTEDGKGPSIWDMFCQKPGAVWQGHSGATACDHYHRYKDDVALMKQVGLKAYRLSLCWPRLVPEGTGALNSRGVAFYSRLIDALLEAGITPWVTLFHWDYPLALYHRGGWLNRDSADWFADYARIVADALSDRVKHFFTLNEPQVYIGFGQMEGVHAPGEKLPLSQMLLAGHVTMLAHGKAVQALRASAKQPLLIGYAPVGLPRTPYTDSAEDLEAARSATFTITEKNSWNNSWWMDPVLRGEYPEQGLEFFGADVPKFPASDLAVMAQPLDFFGVNIYQSAPVRVSAKAPGFERVEFPTGYPTTAFNWPITPEALYWGPRFFHERYQKPVVITENGLSCRDWISLDGKVHDAARIDFTRRYLRELQRAHGDGVALGGYFHWSIMDNFEWAAGYRERFGLIHVDYETQERTLKDSAHWYRGVIESNGAALFE